MLISTNSGAIAISTSNASRASTASGGSGGGQPGGNAQPVQLNDGQARQAVDQMLNQNNWEGVATLSRMLQQNDAKQWDRMRDQVQQQLSQRMASHIDVNDHGGRGTAIAQVARSDPSMAKGLYYQAETGLQSDRRDDLARGFYRGLGSTAMNDLARQADGRQLLERAKAGMSSQSDGVSDVERRYTQFLDNKLQNVQLDEAAPQAPTAPEGQPSYTDSQARTDAIALAGATWRDGSTFLGKWSGSGMGTDEDLVWKTLEPRSSADVQMIRDAYRQEFDRDLDADLRGDMGGADLDHVDALLQGGRGGSEADPAVRNADADASAIHAELNGTFGSNDEVLQRLEKVPYEHRVAVAEAYAKRYATQDERADAVGLLMGKFKTLGGFNDDAMVRADGLFKAPSAPTADGKPQALSVGDAKAAAGRLHIGLYQVADWLPLRKNADVGTVHDVLRTHGDAEKLKLISQAYQTEYGESLEAVISRRLDGADRDVALSLFKRPPAGDAPEAKAAQATWQADQDAARVHWSVDGRGTREGTLRATLEGKTAEQIDAISLRWFDRYASADQKAAAGPQPDAATARQAMGERIGQDLGGGEKAEILHLLEAPRAADEAGQLQWQAAHDARRIKMAVDGMGTDEALISEVLAGKSKPEIEAIAAAYEKDYGKDLRSRLTDEMGGSRDQVEIVEQSYDLGTLDTTDKEAAAAELMLRVRQRDDFEKTGWANALSKGGGGGDWLSDFQNRSHVIFQWDTNYKSDAELVQQDLTLAQKQLEAGNHEGALQLAEGAEAHVENLISNKDATTNLVAEAAVLVVTTPIVLLSGGTLTPVQAVMLGAMAGGTAAGVTYGTMNSQIGSYEVARHALIGVAEGATAGVPIGRAGQVSKELALASRANSGAIRLPAATAAETAARKEAINATGSRLEAAKLAQTALPNTLRSTVKDGAVWGTLGGGTYGFVDAATQHETWKDGVGEGVLKVLETASTSALFGASLGAPLGAGFHGLQAGYRRARPGADGAPATTRIVGERGDPGVSLFTYGDNPPKGSTDIFSREATLHAPGTLSHADLNEMAEEVFKANMDLPGNHYKADQKRVQENPKLRAKVITQIQNELDAVPVVRVRETLYDAQGQLIKAERTIGGAAVTPDWRDKTPSGHWVNAEHPEKGYSYLSHLWSAHRTGAGPDVTQAAIVAAQRELGQDTLGFYTRWGMTPEGKNGAQSLYGAGLGGHPDSRAPEFGSTAPVKEKGPLAVPRMRITEASFTPDAAKALRDVPESGAGLTRENLPDEIRDLIRKNPTNRQLNEALAKLENPIQYAEQLPHRALRVSYGLDLLHDGERFAAAASGVSPAKPMEAGTVYMGANRDPAAAGGLPEGQGRPPDLNLIPRDPEFAGRRAAMDGYVHDGSGFLVAAHTRGVTVRTPGTSGADDTYAHTNWPVDAAGKPLSPFEMANEIRAAGGEGRHVQLVECILPDAYLQALSRELNQNVYVTDGLVHVYRDGELGRIDVRPEGAAFEPTPNTDVRAVPVRQFRPQDGTDAPFPTLALPEGLVPSVVRTNAHIRQGPVPVTGEGYQGVLGEGSPVGETTVFVKANEPWGGRAKPGTPHTTTRTATLHSPGSLPPEDLRRLAEEVYGQNFNLPDSHYAPRTPVADAEGRPPTEQELAAGREESIWQIEAELGQLHLVRLRQVGFNADGEQISDDIIAGGALTTNWRGEDGNGAHWLADQRVPSGYTYLSHLWAKQGSGGELTEAAIMSAEQHLDQAHFGFYTRWNGAQNLYGPRIGAHLPEVPPAANASAPRLHVTEARFTDRAAAELLGRKAGTELPDRVAREVEAVEAAGGSADDLQRRLVALDKPEQFVTQLPDNVLRASYEMELLHEGVRLHPAADPGAGLAPTRDPEAAFLSKPPVSQVYIGANRAKTVEANTGVEHVNMLSPTDEPALHAAAEHYARTFGGQQVIGHARSVYVRSPDGSGYRNANWPVDETGAPVSPFDMARRLAKGQGSAVLVECNIDPDYLQTLADLLQRKVYNPKREVATFVNDGRLSVDVGRVKPDANGQLPTDTDVRAIPLEEYVPRKGVVPDEATYPRPDLERDPHVPSLTAPYAQHPAAVAPTTDGFHGYLGRIDPTDPQAKLDELSKVEQQASLAEHVGLTQARSTWPPATADVPGWKDISGDATQLSQFGLLQRHLQPDPPSRFVARLYVPDGSAATAGLAPQLVFRGTAQGYAPQDWVNNSRNFAGLEAPYYQQAREIGRQLARQPNVDVELVGHSLGGGLASVVSLMSGKRAVTFNAAGVSTRFKQQLREFGELKHPHSPIQAYNVAGEGLTRAQRSALTPLRRADGENISMAEPTQRSTSPSKLPEVVRRHLIGDVKDSLAEAKTHVQAYMDARANPEPPPVHQAGSVSAGRPFAHFGGTTDAIEQHLDSLLANPRDHAEQIDTLAREALMAKDVAAYARGDAPLGLPTRDRRQLYSDFKATFLDGTPAADLPLGLAQLEQQADAVQAKLAGINYDLRPHAGHTQTVFNNAEHPVGKGLPAQAAGQPAAATADGKLKRALRTTWTNGGSAAWLPVTVMSAVVMKGPELLAGSAYQMMALGNRSRGGFVNGSSAAVTRMRENALRGIQNGESFEQAAVHVDRLGGWRGKGLGLTRQRVPDDVVNMREKLHDVYEAKQQYDAARNAQTPVAADVAAADAALKAAESNFRTAAPTARTMAANHPLGNVVRNVSLTVSAATVYSVAHMARFGADYGHMHLYQKIIMAAPSVSAGLIQAGYMVAQMRALREPMDAARKALEGKMFWAQAWTYPALVASDTLTAGMGLLTHHPVEGAAYAARAALDIVLWRMVMKRAKPETTGPRVEALFQKSPLLEKIFHPKEPLDPQKKHVLTLLAVGGLIAASGTAFAFHPGGPLAPEPTQPPPEPLPTDKTVEPAPSKGASSTNPSADPGATPSATSPTTTPSTSPSTASPTTTPSRQPTPPRNVPIVATTSDHDSLWRVAGKNLDTLLTDEHRQRIAADKLSPSAQTVLALGELIRLNRAEGGDSAASLAFVPAATRGHPDTLQPGQQLIVSRA